MLKKPDFFVKGFKMERVNYCESCKKCTMHHIEVIADSPKDNVVHCMKACLLCLEAHNKKEKLGIKSEPPVFYQRYFVEPYVYLVLHPHFIEPDP